jgi:muramoyltetrapeptide carboxypeptidase
VVKPPALRVGDTIGVVAPAAAVRAEMLEQGIAALRAMGYRVKVSTHALNRAGIVAGTDEVRARELSRFFADPSVRAIFAARGGYGSGRLLPLLDFAELRRSPKIFLGFSDETFLLNALVAQASMVAFHGPMVAMDFARGLDGSASAHLKALLAGELTDWELPGARIIRPGRADGELIGGCLSVIAAMMATPWQPDFAGRILFLEDTGEKAYRLDRMLTQLRQSGILRQVAGIAFGAFKPVPADYDEAALIADTLSAAGDGLECPVVAGFEVGHGSANFTLPLGLFAHLDGERGRLVFKEAAVRV